MWHPEQEVTCVQSGLGSISLSISCEQCVEVGHTETHGSPEGVCPQRLPTDQHLDRHHALDHEEGRAGADGGWGRAGADRSVEHGSPGLLLRSRCVSMRTRVSSVAG